MKIRNFTGRGRAVTVKKSSKESDALSKLLFFQSKPIHTESRHAQALPVRLGPGHFKNSSASVDPRGSEASLARARVLARLVSLAQMGEFARRLSTGELVVHIFVSLV